MSGGGAALPAGDQGEGRRQVQGKPSKSGGELVKGKGTFEWKYCNNVNLLKRCY